MTTVLRDTPPSVANPIIELVAQGLGKHPAAQLWRKLVAVDLSFYKSDLAQEVRAEVLEELRVELSEEIRAEVADKLRAEAEMRRAAEDVLDVLDVRGIGVPEEVRERITGCADPEILRRWHRRAVTAATVEEIFAEETDEPS